jgi:uncharacterized protein
MVAAQINASNQCAIMWNYANVGGMPQDVAEAIIWYQKSTAQGDINAQFNLAEMYFNGDGITQDRTLAYAWVNLAAVSGDDEIVEKRNSYESKLSVVEKNKAHRLSSGWIKWQCRH